MREENPRIRVYVRKFFGQEEMSLYKYILYLRERGLTDREIERIRIRIQKRKKAAIKHYKIAYHTTKFLRRHGLLPAKRILMGRHTREEWEALKERYGFKCFYCGKEKLRLTKDHIVPVSKGGSNAITNIVPACRSCNSKKHTKAIEHFQEGAMLSMV